MTYDATNLPILTCCCHKPCQAAHGLQANLPSLSFAFLHSQDWLPIDSQQNNMRVSLDLLKKLRRYGQLVSNERPSSSASPGELWTFSIIQTFDASHGTLQLLPRRMPRAINNNRTNGKSNKIEMGITRLKLDFVLPFSNSGIMRFVDYRAFRASP